jgi:hypothetical protein
MAKQSGLGDNFYIGGYDLSGDVASLDKISGGPALQDVTPLKAYANTRLPLLRQGSWSFTTYFEKAAAVTTPAVPATTVPYVSTYNQNVYVTVSGGTVTVVNINGTNVGSGDGTYLIPPLGTITLTYSAAPTWLWWSLGAEHDALSVIPTSPEVATYARGTAIGNPAAGMYGLQYDYNPTRDNTGGLTLSVDLISDGYGYDWCTQLTPGLREDTVATNGAALDNGAASAYGMQAYVQLVGFEGTSVDIDIEHSPDNSTWSSILDFGAMTAIGSNRMQTSNTTTIDRYLRVITTGTFTFALFNVAVCRNSIAGVSF